MYQIKYYGGLLLAALSLSSCNDQEFKAPNSLADVSWHINTESGNNTPVILQTKKYFSIMDVSQGTLSHTFEVSSDSAFILESAPENMTTDFTPYIDHTIEKNSEGKYVTEKGTINVLYLKAGLHTIRLRNTFDRMVSYTYRPDSWLHPDLKVTKYAERIGDVFVMDTTIVIEVYDNVIQPGAKVYLDSLLTQEVPVGMNSDSTNQQVEIEYGQTLYFVDDSYYKPNYFAWDCTAANIPMIEGRVVPMTFMKMTKETPFRVSQTVERVEDLDNKYVPVAAPKSTTVKLDIFVGPSTKPVEYKGVTLVDENRLAIALGNAGFDAASISNQASGFSLDVLNDYQGREPFTAKYTASSIAVDPEQENVLWVDFAEPLYNTDELSLSFAAPDEPILTVDGRQISTIEPFEVEKNLVQLLDPNIFDFNMVGLHESWWSETAVDFTVVPDPFDPSQKCMKLDFAVGGTKMRSKHLIQAPAGDYVFTCKVYPGEMSSTKSVLTVFLTGPTTVLDKTFSNNKAITSTDLNKPATGWIELTGIVLDSPGGKDRTFYLQHNASIGTYYIKDLSLTNEQIRP